jgi:hypothetical protein
MDSPLLLYSTSTWLAFAVAERFYGGVHYAWCSPFYDGATAGPAINIPPTASPAEIYKNLHDESRRGERHSASIARNKLGILRGAQARADAGAIGSRAQADIAAIVDAADTRDFRPVLYVIPFESVRGVVAEVPVHDRAHPLSVEYRVESLPRACFDMLELRS